MIRFHEMLQTDIYHIRFLLITPYILLGDVCLQALRTNILPLYMYIVLVDSRSY